MTVAIGIFDEVMLGYENLLIADVINMAASDVLETVTGSDWVWNQETKRYRNTETGETLTENKQVQLRDTAHNGVMDGAGQRVDGGTRLTESVNYHDPRMDA